MKAMIAFIVATIGGWCVVGGEAAAAANPESTDYEKLRRQYEARRADLASPLSKLNRKYSAELHALREKAVANGDLDLTLGIEEEVKSLEKGNRGPTSSKSELARIQKIYTDEKELLTVQREQELKVLVAAYVGKLRALERSLTSQDKIDSALQVRSELQHMGKLSEALESSNLEILTSRQWTRFDVKIRKQRVFEFDKDGGISAVGIGSSWKKWDSAGRTIVMSQANGSKHEFVIRREETPIVIEEVRTGRSEFYFVEKER